jgi:hypothetical protein
MQEHIVRMAKTAAFYGRISAGIDCKLKMVIDVFTELGDYTQGTSLLGYIRHRDVKQTYRLFRVDRI